MVDPGGWVKEHLEIAEVALIVFKGDLEGEIQCKLKYQSASCSAGRETILLPLSNSFARSTYLGPIRET